MRLLTRGRLQLGEETRRCRRRGHGVLRCCVSDQQQLPAGTCFRRLRSALGHERKHDTRRLVLQNPQRFRRQVHGFGERVTVGRAVHVKNTRHIISACTVRFFREFRAALIARDAVVADRRMVIAYSHMMFASGGTSDYSAVRNGRAITVAVTICLATVLVQQAQHTLHRVGVVRGSGH